MYEPINAVVVMGVAGSGKSAVARALEVRTGARLIEGDAFHHDRNIQKMSSGQPLTDKDRASWLRALEKQLQRAGVDGAGVAVPGRADGGDGAGVDGAVRVAETGHRSAGQLGEQCSAPGGLGVQGRVVGPCQIDVVGSISGQTFEWF